MVASTLQAGRDRAAVLELLQQVKDPEVPVLSIVELGIVRGVEVNAGAVEVSLTPTYSGCPAMNAIEEAVVQALTAADFCEVRVRRVFNPPWTTAAMSAEARQKLRDYGIAPPSSVRDTELIPLARVKPRLNCPFCGSARTREESEFGATACKSLYFCDGCQQPFEYFKAI